jgi:hypothetical protein
MFFVVAVFWFVSTGLFKTFVDLSQIHFNNVMPFVLTLWFCCFSWVNDIYRIPINPGIFVTLAII